MTLVRRAFHSLLRRPALRLGVVENSRGPCRNPRFVSFLVQNNRRSLDTDFQDAILAGRKFMRRVMILSLIGGGAWVAIESARALTVF